MEKHKNIEVLKEGGLKCDNTECDYTNNVLFEDYTEWINKPCPKCGENLLTEEDYKNAESLRIAIDMINAMSPEELKIFSKVIPESFKKNNPMFDNLDLDDISNEDLVKMKISTHKKISIEDIKKVDNNNKK